MKTRCFTDIETGWKFIVGIYDCEKDMKSLQRLCDKSYPDLESSITVSEFKECAGYTASHPSTKIILILFNIDSTKDSFMYTVAHECFHASTRVMEFIGNKLTSKTQETYARHFEWVFKSVVGKLI